MKRSRLTEGQIIGILNEHQAGLGARDPVAHVRRTPSRTTAVVKETLGFHGGEDATATRHSVKLFGKSNGRSSGGLPPFRSRRCSTLGDGSRGVC